MVLKHSKSCLNISRPNCFCQTYVCEKLQFTNLQIEVRKCKLQSKIQLQNLNIASHCWFAHSFNIALKNQWYYTLQDSSHIKENDCYTLTTWIVFTCSTNQITLWCNIVLFVPMYLHKYLYILYAIWYMYKTNFTSI